MGEYSMKKDIKDYHFFPGTYYNKIYIHLQ